MRILGSLFGKSKEESLSASMRDMLFGDIPFDRLADAGSSLEVYPWSAFASARANLAGGCREAGIACLWEIAQHTGLESRAYLQAWHFLREQDCDPPADIAKTVLGIVVEVGMPKGLDLLAAYADHTACYYNFSSTSAMGKHPDESLDRMIDNLLAASNQVAAKIGPWHKPRPAAPPRGHVRMSFLMPSGLCFKQGRMDVISKDPLGGQVFRLAAILMRALIAKAEKGQTG